MSVLGIGPQVKKFEEISSNDHQMSLTGLGMSRKGVCPRAGGYVQWVCPEGMSMSRRYPHHVTYTVMHVTLLTPPPLDRMMDRCL